VFAALVDTGLPTAGAASAPALAAAQRTLAEAREFLSSSLPPGFRGQTIADELIASCRLADAGLARLAGADSGEVPDSSVMQHFQDAWLKSSRPGGLADSVAKLRRHAQK